MSDTPNPIPEDVAEALEDGVPAVRAFRVDAEISVGELAEQTGIPPKRIDEIEEGSTPTVDELAEIAAVLAVPPDVLVNE